jgi:hypothetical protein
MVLPSGQGVKAVDALVVFHSTCTWLSACLKSLHGPVVGSSGPVFTAVQLGRMAQPSWAGCSYWLAWVRSLLSALKAYYDYQRELEAAKENSEAKLRAASFVLKARVLNPHPHPNELASQEFNVRPGTRVDLHGFNCTVSFSFTCSDGFCVDTLATEGILLSVSVNLRVKPSVPLRLYS